jgi:poly(hydroxyalkanoate) depolymerase family esterase
MNDTLQDLMRVATRLTQSGRLSEATAAIQRALNGSARPPPSERNAMSADRAPQDSTIIDLDAGDVREVAVDAQAPFEPSAKTPQPDANVVGSDQFISGALTAASRTGRYKLYIPPNSEGRSLPLVVLLHGCTQDPDDFAAGTGMNERAREQGFFVLYPAQSQEANASRCWNWFKHNHQRRDAGEPALIAEMTRAVIAQFDIDQQRVFIAGLSAGGAMAAVVADAYPDLFAAVGIHSGLPRGAAGNLQQALTAMKSPKAALAKSESRVPTIVFHGDEDRTVHPANGEQAIAVIVDHDAKPRIEQGKAPGGRRYTRSIHFDPAGVARAELWMVHGAGHAWSGGRAAGSYTDASGPDATGEMLRFFLEHPRVVTR